jgi:prefoldin subunit 5
MSREKLEARLVMLRKELEQIQANGNAMIGAIAECEYWLKETKTAEETDSPEPETKVKQWT